jgi:hypothetical protein
MPKKRYNAEEIIHKLREADVLLSQGRKGTGVRPRKLSALYRSLKRPLGGRTGSRSRPLKRA